MQQLEVRCKFQSHGLRQVQAFCQNAMCDRQRLACFECLKQIHQSHMDDIKPLDEFEKWKNEKRNFIDRIIQLIKELESTTCTLKRLIGYNVDITDFQTFTTDQLTQLINNMIQFKSIGTVIENDLESLSQQMKKMNENTLLKSTMSNIEILEQSLKQNQQQQFQYINIYDNFRPSQQNKFRFNISQENGFRIKQLGKVADGTAGFCLCERPIPKDRQITLGFKIQGIGLFGDIYIGIKKKDQFNNQNLNPDLKIIGHGFYIINDDGYAFSHHQKEKNNIKISYEIEKNETIILKVDLRNKMITWLNQFNNSIALELDNNEGEFYHCVGFNSFFPSTIEIIDQV